MNLIGVIYSDNYGNYLLETDMRVYIGNKLNFGSCGSLSSIYQFIVRLSSAWQCKLTCLSTPITNICIHNRILCKYVTSKYTHGIKSNSYILREQRMAFKIICLASVIAIDR